jgi:hypothetical protein
MASHVVVELYTKASTPGYLGRRRTTQVRFSALGHAREMNVSRPRFLRK